MRACLSRALTALTAVLLTAVLAGPAMGATASISVVDAALQPGGSSVLLTVEVTCVAPEGATSTLSTTILQGKFLRPEQPRYLEGQGQATVVCDGTPQTMTLMATTTVFYADKRFKPGRAMTESVVQYCVFDAEGNGTCTPIFPLVRESVRIQP